MSADPYLFNDGFEAGIVALCATSRRFWSRIGHEIDPELLRIEPAKVAMRAAKAIALETGKGPLGAMLVLQRLHQYMAEGKVTRDQIKAVAALLDDAIDAGLPSEEAAVVELRPILAKRLRSTVVETAIDDYGRGGDLTRVQKLITRIGALGAGAEHDVTDARSPDVTLELIQEATLERLPTGVAELDMLLEGGPIPGTLSVMLGGTNDGKSMWLTQLAACAALSDRVCAIATLENPRSFEIQHIRAAMLGWTIAGLRETTDQRRVDEALERLAPAPFFVSYFTPQVTPFSEIEEWVMRVEDKLGRAIDVLITDYGDKLCAPKSSGIKASDTYAIGLAVFEDMRRYAVEHRGGPIWHWTASQAQRKKDKKSTLTSDDIADSMHKARVSDLILSILREEDPNGASTARIKVAKNRWGPAGGITQPLPTNFAGGLVAPFSPLRKLTNTPAMRGSDEAKILETWAALVRPVSP